MDTKFSFNPNELAAKVIDGEAIIINLTNGVYYSADGSGAMIWQAIEAGCSLDQISDELARHFDAEKAKVSSDVIEFANHLVSEELIRPEAISPEETSAMPAWGEAQGDYATPSLEKYNDMAHFFALDPPLPAIGDDE